MAWFADLAEKAESLLNNIDEQTGAALRSHSGARKKSDRPELNPHPENPPWNSKRRPAPKTTRKPSPVTETRSNYNAKKITPISRLSRSQTKENNEVKEQKRKLSKSPRRKSIYNLENSPDTLVGDLKDNDPVDQFGLRQRRYSLPTDLDVVSHDSFTIKMQNLEVENSMLKNELNVMNREVSELLDRLRDTEDGNDVVSDKELHTTSLKLADTEFLNSKIESDKASLTTQLEVLKRKVNNLTSVEIARQRDQNKSLQFEVDMLRGRNKDLEDLIRQTNERCSELEESKVKIENELKHAQTNINDLESNLEKTTVECRRLETEWDTYKLRVKTMLFNKDKEIRVLQEGLNLTEDTKILIEQIDVLKEEREELSEAVGHVRGECAEMRRHVEQLEARHDAAQRVASALRDALREERHARTRAEAQCAARRKELIELENDTNHTITSLRTMLREKEHEISLLREASVRSADTSALNVADYDLQTSIDQDKIHYLTQTLVQKQGKIDSLLADNNMMRIQMEKLESKYRSELAAPCTPPRHSVVTVDEGRRGRAGDSALGALSRRIALALKRHPVFRVFMIFYMLGLHLWVVTVLLTSTPEGYISSRQKVIPNEA